MTTRKAYIVYVDRNPIRGLLHTPESILSLIQVTLENRLPRYKPTVALAPESTQPAVRVALVVEVNLDDDPGTMHTQESAQNILRNVIYQRAVNLKPIVSLAPGSFQPAHV